MRCRIPCRMHNDWSLRAHSGAGGPLGATGVLVVSPGADPEEPVKRGKLNHTSAECRDECCLKIYLSRDNQLWLKKSWDDPPAQTSLSLVKTVNVSRL